MTRFVQSSSGAVAVMTALVMPLLLGFGSIGVEVGHWYLYEREMQGAADAAAISAASQYIADEIASNGTTTSTAYQMVGQTYAGLNGFTIPLANTCLITLSGDNCGPVRSLDPRPIICSAPPCIVVEITQPTLQWLSAKASMQPNGLGRVQSVSSVAPTLVARSVVSLVLTQTQTVQGNSCILALANDRNAIQVRGNGDIHANCGLLIDGGRDQNARTPAINSNPLCSDGSTPPCAGLTLSGTNAMVHISSLTVAARTAGPAGSSCPDSSRCFLYNPATTALPGADIFTNTATPDPFASRIFTKPAGQVATAVALAAAGSGYTNGTRSFSVQGGSGPATKFTAAVSGGKVTGGIVIVDPGQYTSLPTNPVSVVADDGKGSGAKFTLTFGNCLPGSLLPAVPVPGRAYCSIPVTNTVNFPSGIYYIEGGDASCIGFCFNAGNTTVTNRSGGVTFVLTNVAGGSNYARFTVSGNNTLSLTAPPNNINPDGSVCSSGCANTTFGMIIFQDRNAPTTTSLDTSGNTTPSTTLNSLSGCGNNPTCRTLSGTLYLPNQTLSFSGNGTVQGTCFGLVSKYLDDSGTPTFQNGCLPGTTGPGGSGSVTGGNLRLTQ